MNPALQPFLTVGDINRRFEEVKVRLDIESEREKLMLV